MGGPNDSIWSALKVWSSDFIQNLSQAPSYLSINLRIDWIIWIWISKIIFVQGSYESLAMLDGKTRQGPFFYDSILSKNSLIRLRLQKAFHLTVLCELSNILNLERLHIRVLKNSNSCRNVMFSLTFYCNANCKSLPPHDCRNDS